MNSKSAPSSDSTLTLPATVIAALYMGFSDRRKDLRGFFFDGEKHRLLTTDGKIMLLYRLPKTFRERCFVSESLAASIRPGKVTLEFQKEGLLRNQEETSKFIPYLDRLCSWDVLDKAIPKTAPSGHPAQYDLNLLLSIQAAAQTILGGEEEPPIHIHHNGHNPTFVTTFCLKNFAALILPKQEWDQDERVLQW